MNGFSKAVRHFRQGTEEMAMTDEKEDVQEIEVTPEMIREGFYALLDFDSDEFPSDQMVVAVYRAMRKIEPQS